MSKTQLIVRDYNFALPIHFVLTLAFDIAICTEVSHFQLQISDWHIKTCLSLKWRAISKIPSAVFYRNFLLTANGNLYEDEFSCVKTKTISHFTVKLLKLLGSFHGAASRTAVFLNTGQ